jgi:hypothetical protein
MLSKTDQFLKAVGAASVLKNMLQILSITGSYSLVQLTPACSIQEASDSPREKHLDIEKGWPTKTAVPTMVPKQAIKTSKNVRSHPVRPGTFFPKANTGGLLCRGREEGPLLHQHFM